MWLKKKKEDVQINLTPLIDVVFLLLIFFMVSTSFKKETKVSLTLPEANGEALESPSDSIEVTVSKTGEVFVNGNGLVNRDVGTIKEALKQSSTDHQTPVIISADAAAPYQAVITVMDAAGQAGFNNLTLPTQKPSSENN
ncbi:ExbD/TolR family protein [Kangiella geojedonensis]|mgnify:FL=1|uniref:Biopolymer transport protein ExbD/TolR n=1 Tax=Kangiella geojedonensis TaxID=914150 RepID=A0A0F6RCH9_9GAMM|nr:biopolymer transporter ExbD [Kangiella geojedonensis]AKE52066.1 Biopolymer transport protein ExbD/TolR [Kangiella geojedonensis]